MRKKGFTLIELLVVIAIIALLLSILMPALRKVKKIASSIVCRSNLRQLSMGLISYASDNEDMIPGSDDGSNSWDWLQRPRDTNGNDVALLASTVDEQIRGIEAGSLYPYTREPKLYHCISDRRDAKESVYRSYGMPGSMNGSLADLSVIGFPGATRYLKYTAIRSPSEKYIFLEEKIDFTGANPGSWNINGPAWPAGDQWRDPVMSWHGGGTSLAFADGHAERHTWLQESTIKMMVTPYPACVWVTPTDGVDDLRYMQRGFY